MRDRAGFFAGCADVLTAMCVYYVVAAVVIVSRQRWGVHLFWLLLCAALCAWIFARLLEKPRSTPFLTAVTIGLFLAVMGVFALVSGTPIYFGYAFVLAVGGGMAAGMPLYYALHRPLVHRHLTYLDVLIIALLSVVLVREALGIDGGTVALMVAVLLMDAAGAVGLRMSDGESGVNGGNAFKGTMVALCAAAALSLVIWLFTAIFSRSGAVTAGVVSGLGAFLAAVGGGIERFFLWLSSLVHPASDAETLTIEGELPSIAAAEQQAMDMDLSVDTEAIGIALCILVIIATVIVAVVFRKKRFSREMPAAAPASGAAVRRTGGTMEALWKRLRDALRFRWTAFVRRDTPAGLLVTLERMGKRRHTPRRTGESMRQFIRRMDAGGGLDALSDALDREYYGGGGRAMSAKQCRALRRYMKRHLRKAVQHG